MPRAILPTPRAVLPLRPYFPPHPNQNQTSPPLSLSLPRPKLSLSTTFSIILLSNFKSVVLLLKSISKRRCACVQICANVKIGQLRCITIIIHQHIYPVPYCVLFATNMVV